MASNGNFVPLIFSFSKFLAYCGSSRLFESQSEVCCTVQLYTWESVQVSQRSDTVISESLWWNKFSRRLSPPTCIVELINNHQNLISVSVNIRSSLFMTLDAPGDLLYTSKNQILMNGIGVLCYLIYLLKKWKIRIKGINVVI